MGMGRHLTGVLRQAVDDREANDSLRWCIRDVEKGCCLRGLRGRVEVRRTGERRRLGADIVVTMHS